MTASDDRGPRVSVVIPALDAARTLPRALESLAEQELAGDFEVVIVNDASSDRTGEIAEAAGPRVRVVNNTRRLGARATRNAGVAAARAPILAFTDADCFPTPTWLAAGLKATERAELVQGRVEPDPRVPRAPFDRTLTVQGLGYFQTANLLVRRELFERLGGFEDFIVGSGRDPQFGWRAPADGRDAVPARRPIGEDVLFGWRARQAEAAIAWAPEALVHHAVFPGSAREAMRARWNWRHLPAVAARIPEVRGELFYRRIFFDRRTADFDLGLVGLAAALGTRRLLPLLGLAPYARRIAAEAALWGLRRGAVFAAGLVATDLATAGALVAGSVAWRTLLI